jgi:O-antigen ligase
VLLAVAAWAVTALLWATGAIGPSFAVFLGALLSAAVATGALTAAAARGKKPLRGARAAAVIVLCAAVPVVFDPHSGDVFNLPKYTVMVIGALVLAALWTISGVHDRALPRWRNGLQWLVAAIIVWTAVSALAGVDLRIGLLGNYGSYDGLYSAAAFGVIMMVAAEALDAEDVRRALGALAFGGGTVVVVYGFLQFHDSELHGSTWDFIHWHLGSFSTQVFSTFGNPNHLAGYLAMVLPIVLVLGLGARRLLWRLASGVLALAVVGELVRTAARGAWVGALVALAVLAVCLAPELLRRPAAIIGAAGGVLMVIAAGVAAFGRRFLGQPLSSLFQTGGTSSVEQRAEIWRSALRIAVHYPFTGTGPDTFALVYPRYQSAAWVKGFTAEILVNGAHDIFMNVLADQGFIGLALFLALLAFVGLRAAGSWRRLRSVERDEAASPELRARAQRDRVSMAVTTASITAYIVQAVFNVQQVGLSFAFWALVGLLAALAQAAGVPGTLRPGAVLSVADLAVTGPQEAVAPAAPSPARPARPARPRGPSGPRRPARQPRKDPLPTVLTTAALTAAVALLALGADGPYRADHSYWAAYASLHQTAGATSTSSPNTPVDVGAAYFDDMQHAMTTNPWEPTYPAQEATLLVKASAHSPTAPSDLMQARTLLVKAVAESPMWWSYPYNEAEVDMDLALYQASSASVNRAAAVSLARKAHEDNPRDPAISTLLSQALRAEHATPAKS